MFKYSAKTKSFQTSNALSRHRPNQSCGVSGPETRIRKKTGDIRMDGMQAILSGMGWRGKNCTDLTQSNVKVHSKSN